MAERKRKARDLTELLAMPDCAQMTSAETGLFLGRDPITLYRWRRRGGGPVFCRVGGLVAYIKRDVMKWRDERRYRDRAHELDEAAKRQRAA